MENLTSEERGRLRLYFRLVLSYKDFKHALKCAEWLISQGDDYIPQDELAKTAHYCSMVVSYARPFNSGGTSEHGRVPRLTLESLPNVTSKDLEIHRYVLLCRNEMVAHTDAEALDLETVIATDMPGEHVVPLVNDALAPFVASYTREFASLAERWLVWVVEERFRVEPMVLPFLKRSTWNEIHGVDT